MLLNCGVGEDSWKFLGLQGDPTSPSYRKSVLNIHWKYWCWSWNSNTLATWCKELTNWKRPWCWERLKAGRKGDDRGWDGWMASPTQWTWVWVIFGSWWWTGKPGVLQSRGLQRVGQDWVTELTDQPLTGYCVLPSTVHSLCSSNNDRIKTQVWSCRCKALIQSMALALWYNEIHIPYKDLNDLASWYLSYLFLYSWPSLSLTVFFLPNSFTFFKSQI